MYLEGLSNVLLASNSFLTKILCLLHAVPSPPPVRFDFVILKYYFICNKSYEASNYAVSHFLFLHSLKSSFRPTRNGQNTLKEVNPPKKEVKNR
jgi:hypothetical protein